MLDTIRRVAPKLAAPEVRRALMDQADAIREVSGQKPLATIDRRDIEAAWRLASEAVAPSGRAI